MRLIATMMMLLTVPTILSGGSDDDGDGTPNELDCMPNDPSIWAAPGEPITDLALSRAGETATLSWSLPEDLGGLAGTEKYDTLAATAPDAFGHPGGYCVDIDGTTLSATDDRPVGPGQTAYYLVRVENDCGVGPIDTDPPPFEPRSVNYLVVTNTNDSGSGSLREAIDLAVDGDAICIDVTGTIVLSTGYLLVDEDISIVGPGASLLTITPASTDSHLLGLSADAAVCSGITIDGAGLTTGGVQLGGGSTLDSMTVQGNSTGVRRTVFEAPMAVIHDSLIQDNDIGVDRSFSGPLTITNTTISNNGTGIRNYVSSKPLNIVSSTLHSNTVGFDVEYGYSATLVSSTISGNGTGVRMDYGGVTLRSSTISGNEIGFWVGWEGGFASVRNTIVSNSQNCYYYGYEGSVGSTGYSIFSDTSCGLSANPGDQNNVDPLLGPLADNKGPTMTRMPLPGSPAIDAGNCAGETRDQRILPRPVDDPGTPNVSDGCDIGSVERQESDPD